MYNEAVLSILPGSTDSSNFNGARSRMYEAAMQQYPEARREDIDVLYRHLAPRKGEKILGLGEGNGYFLRPIAEALGTSGEYVVTDPSPDQLEPLLKSNYPQVKIQVCAAQSIQFPENYFDKVWTLGAFHHVNDQTEAMRRVHHVLRPSGRLVLCDVFQGTSVARLFDSTVARFCLIGHEVKFLSVEFARSLCWLAGFDDDAVHVEDLATRWHFPSRMDMAKFIYNLLGMSRLPYSRVSLENIIRGCEDILGVDQHIDGVSLRWDIKVLTAIK